MLDQMEQHIGAMGVIFAISLLAVSFPAISKKIRFLTIPKILFFIGKHFGTGVILSTAFCHLLQDSFEALTSNIVKSRYPGVGEQTGFIILGALLTIFLIEYISTSYVDHLHEEPSTESSETQEQHTHPTPTSSANPRKIHIVDESTPLLSNSVHSHHSHESPFIRATSLSKVPKIHYLSSIVTNSPRHSRSNDCFYIINDLNYHLNNGEYHLVGGKGSCVCVCVCPAGTATGTAQEGRSKLVVQSPEAVQHENGSSAVDVNNGGDVESQRPALSRKRQVVGILVLQFGIMIHSLVIGLTLSITSGSEFTTLVTAIIFHQLFEGLSLGIRIATLPPKSDSSSSRPSSPSSSRNGKGSPPPSSHGSHRSLLQPVLTILFAITTPLGIALGMLVFSSTGKCKSSIPPSHSSEARMLLTQGLMSSISAGLLIYSATVEMIAGDFVFGNLGGHGTGTHGSAHSHGEELAEEDVEAEEGVSPKRRILAVGSLLAGVLAMGMIGLGE
ncbi:Zinc/iron permease [Gymnopus androsaceus JB14]|uniref:Zinc/iron permease n=1 Tax=Gymnopus androsaceus JB14 TaxID=1447944 RepID=A0A6A4GY92_9AGAR|nr:Zinc/iron permease [Gymnopus androsaceus JB14]